METSKLFRGCCLSAMSWGDLDKDHLRWVSARSKPWHSLPGNLPQIWQKLFEYEVLPKKHLGVGCVLICAICLPS